ncbi:MAG: PqqD family protein [Clostridiales bacterium]|nr:PqqD family protein [Clostridiales bacterium]
MKKFVPPSIHVVEHVGPLNNAQFAAMSDSELEAYLRENGYWEKKKLYRANHNYALREIAGEHVLVPTGDLPGDRMITLNRSCAFLWQQLQEQKTIGDLIFAARQRFADPNGELEKHIQEFVEYRVQTGHIWEVK